MASEAYGLLGGVPAVTEPPPTALGRLFLETVTIQTGTAAVHAMTQRLSGGTTEVSDSVFDYLSARSAWVALTAAPHLPGLGLTDLLRAALEGLETLDALGRQAWERLAQDGSSPRVTDGMTLSLALWSSALRVRWSALELLALSEAESPEVLTRLLAQPPSDGRAVMARVIDMGRNAVLVAGQMTGNAPTEGTWAGTLISL